MLDSVVEIVILEVLVDIEGPFTAVVPIPEPLVVMIIVVLVMSSDGESIGLLWWSTVGS